MMDFTAIRLLLGGYLTGLISKAREDERGLNSMEYAAIIAGVLVVVGVLVAAITLAATGKINNIK